MSLTHAQVGGRNLAVDGRQIKEDRGGNHDDTERKPLLTRYGILGCRRVPFKQPDLIRKSSALLSTMAEIQNDLEVTDTGLVFHEIQTSATASWRR